MKIAIIGGGAAGLMAASLINNAEVTIFDSNDKCGRKLYITGKGRCNLTNNCDKSVYLENVVRGKKFMQGAISRFDSARAMEYFEALGLQLITERGNRVFPASNKSSDVIKALTNACAHCDIKLKEKVLSVKKSGGGFSVKTSYATYQFDKVIVATGGKSYSATGSTGDGYKIAKSFGHTITEPKPALVPIKLKRTFYQGLPLKNVTLNANADGKKYAEFGEMLFTTDGITGPIVLTMSSLINRAREVELSLDLKPALSESQLDARILREFDVAKNKSLKSVMYTLLPKNFVEAFLSVIKIDGEQKVNSVTAETRARLINGLKNFKLEYNGLYDIEAGIVTSGGVNLDEVSPKDMQSKLAEGLYFIGEVLDVDCLTGGFNLQTAFSTAYACALALNAQM